MIKHPIDKQLLISILLLVSAGFLIFLSASLGLLARDSLHFSSVALKQICFGLIPGLIALYLGSRIDFRFWKKIAFWFFVLAIFLNIIIFIPGLGLRVNGAVRWLQIGNFSIQVSEFLKIAAIMYFAAWLSFIKEKVTEWKQGFLPLIIILSIVGVLCLLEPDTDTFIVISASLVTMYILANGKWRYLGLLACVGIIGFTALAFTRPYVMARITTFINPSEASLTNSYQIQQSLIAVGSGGIVGRGFGQSIQKFNFLPEPVGDSIFAVEAEEFGFLGSVALVTLFVFFAIRTLKIAGHASDPFGGLLAIGIITFIILQSFVNIGAMIGILPLSGIPLLFVSQGGTALLFVLAESGIILNISRYAKIR